MILTITMNPSIDISYPMDSFKVDTVNRTNRVSKTAGGKGLNVTRVLKELDKPVLATGFLGGYLGKFIENALEKVDINHSFYQISQETRNCIAILHDGKQTEILEGGPTISKEEAAGFLKHFTSLLDTVDVITISGSLPNGLNKDFYAHLIDLADNAGKKVLLDTSGTALEESLKNDNKPFLIKPNQEEISQLLHKNIASDYKELKADLNSPLFDGVEWIVVSLGADGAFIKHKDKFYKANIPTIEVVNPVGSGDSTVAGLAAAIYDDLDVTDVFKYGMTTGILNTLEKETGHINKGKFDEYYQLIDVVDYLD